MFSFPLLPFFFFFSFCVLVVSASFFFLGLCLAIFLLPSIKRVINSDIPGVYLYMYFVFFFFFLHVRFCFSCFFFSVTSANLFLLFFVVFLVIFSCNFASFFSASAKRAQFFSADCWCLVTRDANNIIISFISVSRYFWVVVGCTFFFLPLIITFVFYRLLLCFCFLFLVFAARALFFLRGLLVFICEGP